MVVIIRSEREREGGEREREKRERERERLPPTVLKIGASHKIMGAKTQNLHCEHIAYLCICSTVVQ